MAKKQTTTKLPSTGKPGVKPPPTRSQISDALVADESPDPASESGDSPPPQESEAPDRETHGSESLELHQPTAGSKPTVRPGLEQFVAQGTKLDPFQFQEEEEPEVKIIKKTRDPIMSEPEPNDVRWHPRSFEASNCEVQFRVPLALTGEVVTLRRDLDVRRLTQKQNLGLLVLLEGYSCDGSQTDDGNEINSRQQAIRKMLETIADQFVEAGSNA